MAIATSTFKNMRYSSNKDLNQHLKRLVKQGWIFRRKRKHGQIIAPNGERVVFSNSPSDHRALKNFLNDVKHTQKGCIQ